MSENQMNNVNKNDDLFRFIDRDTAKSEKIIAPRYSYWKSVFRVFFRKKSNWVLLGILIFIILFSAIFPIFFPYNPTEYATKATTFNMSPAKAIDYYGDWLKYCLGTGSLGNSIFYGIWSSARISLLLAVICAAINMAIGVVVGAIWGYSKQVDKVMLVIYNIVANVPYILVISVLVYIIGSGFSSFIFSMTITGWLSIAYFFRTQVMIIRDREYCLASKCLGTPILKVVTKNILPFMTSVFVTVLATELPSYISMEVFMSYIGVGLSANVPSLGRMIQEAQTSFLSFPWSFWPPVVISSAITIILYVLGQNLADASDPRTHM